MLWLVFSTMPAGLIFGMLQIIFYLKMCTNSFCRLVFENFMFTEASEFLKMC